MPTNRPRCPTCNAATRGLYSRHGENAVPVRRPIWECGHCARILPLNLAELRTLLLDGHVDDDDWADLPTFGGDEPDTTREVWSWDPTHLLVGSGRDIKLIPRP